MEDIIEYGINNRKAPRFRKERHSLFTLSFYREFRKKYPKYADKKVYPDTLIRKIVDEFNIELSEAVVKYREGVDLPERIGKMFVGNCEPSSKKNLNHMLSGVHKKLIGRHNLQTDGYLAKIFYSNYDNKYTFPARELWMFTAVRPFKHNVSRNYENNWMNYIMVEKHMIINKQYKKKLGKQYIEKKLSHVPENYNEFII